MTRKEYDRRVLQSITETQQALDREQKYPEDLQKKDLVNFYISHLEKLQNMLTDEEYNKRMKAWGIK